MWIGWVEFDLLLGDVRSLKQKRGVIRPIIAALSRRTEAACAEVGNLDQHRRATLAVAAISADGSHVRDVLDAAERLLVAEHPEVELLSAARGLRNGDD